MNEKDKSKSGYVKVGRSAVFGLLALFGLLFAVSLTSAQTEQPVRQGVLPPANAEEPGLSDASPSPVEPKTPAAEGKTIRLTAADLVADGESQIETKATMLRKDKVAVPEQAEGKTVADALEEIARGAGRRLEYLATNVAEVLAVPYEPPSKASGSTVGELCRMLLPAGYSSWEHDNGAYLFVGTDADVNRKRTEFAVESLANNHTRIAFSADKMTIFDAVQEIRRQSKANILTAYMDKEDQYSEKTRESGMISAADVGAGVTNTAPNCRRVTYSTDGAKMEWRTVLSSVLEPDYMFDEVDGKVRVATRARFEQMKRHDIDSRPMELRYVRVFHANPEDIVERLKPMALTQNSKAVIEVAPYREKAEKDPVNSFRHNLSSSSSRLSVGGKVIGDSSSSSSSSWGNLLRPKNPPAILVYDNTENLDRIEAAIRAMDVREKQVLIEALILSLSDDGSRQLGMKLEEMGFGNLPLLGVSWSKDHNKTRSSENTTTWGRDTGNGYNYYYGRGKLTSENEVATEAGTSKTTTLLNTDGKTVFSFTEPSTANSGVPTLSQTIPFGRSREWYASESASTVGKSGNVTSSKRNRAWSTVLGPLDFKFILEMVEENKYGKSLSSPVVTIGDHSEAMIHVGNVRPIVQTETTYSGDNSYPVQSYEWQELLLGLHMWVGPEVTLNGDAVRLWVHPKITSDVGNDVIAPDGSSYPRLRSEELDTRVTVLSGSTLLIGGLTENDESEVLQKVPLLGDIPLLGRLFRWNSRSSGRNNLVILIRPTVLDDDEPDTGFEAPANAIIDPMMATSGRNLKDVVFTVDNDPMRRREKAIKDSIREKFFGRKDPEAESVEAVVEEADDAADATTEAPEGSLVVEGPEVVASVEASAETVETGK